MSALPIASPPGVSRRQRLRQATIDEIKTLARKQLAEQGAGALGLRAIAREMGVASSALYRYFPSRDDLLSAICADAYDSATEAVAAARDGVRPDDHEARWLAICHAYRRWSLDNRAEFALIFGTPVPGYDAPEGITGPAASRLAGVPFEVFAMAVAGRAADPERTQTPPSVEAAELLRHLLDDFAPDYPPRLAAIALTAWASVLGFLVVEIFGSLPRLIADVDELYNAHVRTVMLGMGFDPVRIEAASAAG